MHHPLCIHSTYVLHHRLISFQLAPLRQLCTLPAQAVQQLAPQPLLLVLLVRRQLFAGRMLVLTPLDVTPLLAIVWPPPPLSPQVAIRREPRCRRLLLLVLLVRPQILEVPLEVLLLVYTHFDVILLLVDVCIAPHRVLVAPHEVALRLRCQRHPQCRCPWMQMAVLVDLGRVTQL